MGKLHEVLAANETLKGQADKTRADLLNTFDKKRHLFGEKVVTFHPNREGESDVTEEVSTIQTTVRQELAWIAGIWGKAIDAGLQIALANTQAKGDITLDNGEVLLANVPATALLEMEKRAGEVQDLVMAIPTLDPAKGFSADAQRGKGYFRARPERKNRTKKEQRALVLYPATPEHPAQTQLITEDVVIGHTETQEWSGLITPAQKADMLTRVEALRRAIKVARARANEAAVPAADVAGRMFAYVFGDVVYGEK